VGVKLVGAQALIADLEEIVRRIEDTSLITSRLEEGMREHVPVDTGYLRESIYHDDETAGATAPYAGTVADRDDYAQEAIDAFPVEEYLDELVEPF